MHATLGTLLYLRNIENLQRTRQKTVEKLRNKNKSELKKQFDQLLFLIIFYIQINNQSIAKCVFENIVYVILRY